MNDKMINKLTFWNLAVMGIVSVIAALALLVFNSQAFAQAGGWTEPTVISAPPGFSWFPDLSVDAFGSVHVVWCQTIPLGKRRGLQEQVAYARWNGTDWSQPNDIVPPSADIVRNAIASDRTGNVHLLYGGSVRGSGLALYYQQAFSTQAWSARAWSAPHRINQGISYMGDMEIDSRGVIHVIYDDTIQPGADADEDEWAVADVFYRRSADGGRSWSVPVNLYASPQTGSARPYLEIDSNDVIHATWDEGWDRLSGEGDPLYGGYTFSRDGGKTWQPTAVITYPDSSVAQLTAGSNGQGGVMLVWRTVLGNEMFYQWSADGGQSWSAPAAIPRLFARPWVTPFDMYDMATDSAGVIHLLVVARQSQDPNAPLGVYYLSWDGVRWSSPTRVFAQPGLYPEYPKIVVYAGNQLYAAWFTRAGGVWDDEAAREVWYSSSQSQAPAQIVTSLPTSTSRPPTATPSPVPTITPYPTLVSNDVRSLDSLYTENDELGRLAIALAPVVLILALVAMFRMDWLGRWRN